MQLTSPLLRSRVPVLFAAAVATVVSASFVNAAIIAVDLDDKPRADTDDTANGGLYWNGIEDVDLTLNALKDSAGNASSVTAQIVNGFGFGRENDPVPTAAFTSGGYQWPTAVQFDGAATNLAGRDGLGVVRFTVPVSSGLDHWSITVLGGNVTAYSPWAVNVGGTYVSNDRVFTGGTTASSTTTSGLQVVSLSNIVPTIVGSDYVVDLQFGYTDVGSTSDAAVLRGIVVNATSAIPEPTSLALVGVGAVGLLRRRRGQ